MTAHTQGALAFAGPLDEALTHAGWPPAQVDAFVTRWLPAAATDSQYAMDRVTETVQRCLELGLSPQATLDWVEHLFIRVDHRDSAGVLTSPHVAIRWWLQRLALTDRELLWELIEQGWTPHDVEIVQNDWCEVSDAVFLSVIRQVQALAAQGVAASAGEAAGWTRLLVITNDAMLAGNPAYGDALAAALPATAPELFGGVIRAYLDATDDNRDLALAAARARIDPAEARELFDRGELTPDAVDLLAWLRP